MTDRYMRGDFDEDQIEKKHRFSQRSKNAQQNKTLRTTLMRAAESSMITDLDALPIGRVIQVYSLYCDVEHEGTVYLCVTRKTLARTADSAVVVGDLVRFRAIEVLDEQGRPEAVIEQTLPRQTVLTRADSFKGLEQQPIVANAQQMLIVASLRQPRIKWGIVERMLIAAQSGGLRPIICVNKIDLARHDPAAQADLDFVRDAFTHYASLDVPTVQASIIDGIGLDELRKHLADHTTVLAGHSGVGKSSLIRAIQPHLDLRIGAVSTYTEKGRHTTTSARRYLLDFGGYVIDTPGVRHFGLWKVTTDTLIDFFPDVNASSAPPWREESYQNILESLSS